MLAERTAKDHAKGNARARARTSLSSPRKFEACERASARAIFSRERHMRSRRIKEEKEEGCGTFNDTIKHRGRASASISRAYNTKKNDKSGIHASVSAMFPPRCDSHRLLQRSTQTHTHTYVYNGHDNPTRCSQSIPRYNAISL